MLLRDMIKTRVPCLSPGDTLERAARLFRHAKVDSLPVVDQEQQLLGLLTRTNFLDALLERASLDHPVDTFFTHRAMTVSGAEPYNTVKELVKTSAVGSAPVLDENKRVIGLFTKADMVMTLLKKSDLLNAQLSAVLNAMHSAVVAVGRDSKITLLNKKAEKLLGVSEQNCVGMNYDIILADLELGGVFGGEARLGHKYVINGAVTIANIMPIEGHEAVDGAIIVLQELTEYEQVARELEIVKNLNQSLDTVLNIIYDGIVLVDGAGRVTLLNQALADFLEVSPAQVAGRHITEIIPGSRLHIVARTGVPEISEIQSIRGKELIVSKLPIIKEGQAAGAVGKIIFPQLAEIKELATKLNSLQNKVAYYQEELKKVVSEGFDINSIIAVSQPMVTLLNQCRQVARGSSTVLITGDSGTGKELLARALHNFSDRSKHPFVSINCAAIAESLLESEIFGYAPGAFTGADRHGRPGRFEMAHRGTLFLDEIGDMSLGLQAKLLRVLQEREFQRVGGTKTVRVDVRIVAATNKDLQRCIEEGEFREDLFYRLNVINLAIPPLKERPQDIEPMARHFIQKYNSILKAYISGIAPEALELLLKYPWPGNVRELENTIERAANFLQQGVIEVGHLPSYMVRAETAPAAKQPGAGHLEYRDRLRHTEREIIIAMLEKTGGNKSRAAGLLGMSRSKFYAKLKNLNIGS